MNFLCSQSGLAVLKLVRSRGLELMRWLLGERTHWAHTWFCAGGQRGHRSIQISCYLNRDRQWDVQFGKGTLNRSVGKGVWGKGTWIWRHKRKKCPACLWKGKNLQQFPSQWKSSLNARTSETKHRITLVEFGYPRTCLSFKYQYALCRTDLGGQDWVGLWEALIRVVWRMRKTMADWGAISGIINTPELDSMDGMQLDSMDGMQKRADLIFSGGAADCAVSAFTKISSHSPKDSWSWIRLPSHNRVRQSRTGAVWRQENINFGKHCLLRARGTRGSKVLLPWAVLQMYYF